MKNTKYGLLSIYVYFKKEEKRKNYINLNSQGLKNKIFEKLRNQEKDVPVN